MAFPTVRYDADDGSDINSGSQNTNDTIYTDTSTGETVTDTATATITFSGTVNLSDVKDDDSDMIWVGHAQDEQKLFRIMSFTGGKATCTAVVVEPNVGAAGFGATDTWGIGGIRKTLIADASDDVNNWQLGWKVTLAGGDYLIDGTQDLDTGFDAALSFLRIESSNVGVEVPKIYSTSTSLPMFDTTAVSSAIWTGITFEYRGTGNNSQEMLRYGTGTRWVFDRCHMNGNTGAGGAMADCLSGSGLDASIAVIESELEGFSNTPIEVFGRETTVVLNCSIHDNNNGMQISPGNDGSCYVSNNLFYDNTVNNIRLGDMNQFCHINIVSNTFFNAGSGDNINTADTTVPTAVLVIIYNNVFHDGVYGINATAQMGNYIWTNHNHFGDHTTASQQNVTLNDGDAEAGGDPSFVSEVTPDFTPDTGSALINSGAPVPTK